MNARKIQSIIFNQLGNILDPGLCLGCGHKLRGHQLLCQNCLQLLQRLNHPCRLCGYEHNGPYPVCAACLYDPPRWQQIIAPLQYRGLTRDLLIQFKYSQSLEIATCLVKTVIKSFSQQQKPPEVLIPVPLHHDRLMHRGYNQALEITRLISRELAIPADYNCLYRIRPTQAQAGLSAYKRQKNILKAFTGHNPNGYQHVAVVDDIVTTGATANEITKTLHRAGIKTVEIWGLARVVK